MTWSEALIHVSMHWAIAFGIVGVAYTFRGLFRK